MARDRDTNVGLKDANGVIVGSGLLPIAICGIPVCGMVWTIKSRDEASCLRPNSVEAIIVSGTSLERVVTCVLLDCI
jgi:hypothetical protein